MHRNQFDNLTRRLVDRRGSRRSLLRWAGVLALSGLHVAGSSLVRAAEVADAQCPSPGDFHGYEKNSLAQTFKAQHTGRLTRATVYAISTSTPDTDDYRVEIRTTTRKGKPGNSVLASTVVENIVRPSSGLTTEVTASFASPARVKKGNWYALVITGVDGVPVAVQANRRAGESSPKCPGTLFDDHNRDNTFIKDTSTDIVFATLVAKA
jgi:hypothetical protein